jgi:hypothetical protein
MANGKTVYPTKKQLAKIKKEYGSSRIKKDFLDKYNISLSCYNNVVTNERCSEKIFNKLFK